MKISSSRIYRNIYYALVLALIFFGQGFSKFHVIGPLYLHDLFLFFGVALIFISPPRYLPFPTVLIIGLISIIYLATSIYYHSEVPFAIILRQFALFGYMICYYLLYIRGFNDDQEYARKFIIKAGMLCVVLQVLYICGRTLMGYSVLLDYNYYSPVTVLGIIIASAYFIVYYHKFINKYVLFVVVLLLSTTTGHSSAFLSVFAVGAFYFFLRTTNPSKMIVIITITVSVFALYIFVPQFHDVNAGFRLIAWADAFHKIVIDNFGVFGKGFGVPYFDADLIQKLYVEVGTTGFFGEKNIYEPYLSSVHNSYITIFFSIGLLPGLLILYPFYRLVKYFLNRSRYRSDAADFLFLSLIGLSVWVSFNQILEIPHSSGLFWLVYFTCLRVPITPAERVTDKEISA